MKYFNQEQLVSLLSELNKNESLFLKIERNLGEISIWLKQNDKYKNLPIKYPENEDKQNWIDKNFNLILSELKDELNNLGYGYFNINDDSIYVFLNRI